MAEMKTVLIGVTGGIAAYKAVGLVSDLIKLGFSVHVLMTKNATQFVSPLTFETISSNRVIINTFDRDFEWNVKHVALARKADVAAIVPATANLIGKMANGIADDMLTTTLLALRCPVIVAPAMNTSMYENPSVTRNLEKLKQDGIIIIEPDSGMLACGDVGKGRLADPSVILDKIVSMISHEKDMAGVKVLITAGPTRESIDPARFISNHSTGKMGYELARAAVQRGAKVTLVSGPSTLPIPSGIDLVPVVSAHDMFHAVKTKYSENDIIIKAAAVADYTPETYSEEKIKKHEDELTIKLRKTDDILKWLGEHKKRNQILCGFAMETSNLEENATEKLKQKKVDMIVANSISEEGAGFGYDTNVAMLLTSVGCIKLELMRKSDLSHIILDHLMKMR